MIVYFFRREPSPPKVLLKEGKSFCDPRLFTNVYVIWITSLVYSRVALRSIVIVKF